MFQNLIIAATVLAVIIVYFGSMFAAVCLTKKKINVSALVTQAKAEIPVFDQVVTVLENLLPQPYKAMSLVIVNYIHKAVDLAEELCNAGQLTADQRKAKALELVNTALSLEKVAVTSKVATAISLTIDLAATLFIPHKTETAVLQSTANSANSATTVAVQ